MSARGTMGGKWGVLTTACVIIFIIALNTTAINAAVNALSDDLGISSSTLTWAVNSYLLAVAAVVAVAGRLGDILGARAIILIGLGLFTAATLLVATADSGLLLILGRSGQGLGSAFLMPGSMQAIQQSFPAGERAKALGIWGAIVGIGFAVGPLFGAIWTDALSWRGIYWSDLPMLAIALALALATLGGLPRPQGRKPVDLVGAVVLAVALLLLVLALQRSEFWGFDSLALWGALAASLVLFALFALIEQRRDSPLIHLKLFRIPAYSGSQVATFASQAGLIGLLYFFNLYAQASVTFDDSAVAASVALLPFGLSVFVFSLVAGRVAQRVGYVLPVGGGLVVMAVGFVWFAVVAGDLSIGALWIPLILVGVGVGATFATAGAGGLAVVPSQYTGEAAGAINVGRYVGGAIGLAVASALYLGLGLERFNERLSADGLGRADRGALDKALTGSPAGLQSAIDDLGNPSRDQVASAASDAIVNGFSAAMWFLAAVSLVAAVVTALTMRRRQTAA